MKEIGMLFKAEMVRAILENRKFQTRRLKFRGSVGDVIYVKETWSTVQGAGIRCVYRADGDPKNRFNGEAIPDMKWHPSIFMPKKVARLWLKIVEVRQEPLLHITESDAKDEGTRPRESVSRHAFEYRIAYAELWDSINKDPGTRWDDNPTVFVIKFEVMRWTKEEIDRIKIEARRLGQLFGIEESK